MSHLRASTWDGCVVCFLEQLIDANEFERQAILESNNWINKRQAYELVSTNLEKLLDLEGWIGDMGDLVAYEGGSALDFTSKPIAVVSPARQLVEIL